MISLGWANCLAPKWISRWPRGKGSLFKHGLTYWISVNFRERRIRENTKHTDRKAQDYLDAKLAQLARAKVTGQGT